MIVSVGVDVLSNREVGTLLRKHPRRAYEVIFSRNERDSAGRSGMSTVAYMATRFAAKEATLKVLGINSQVNYELRDIEILGARSLRVKLHGPLADYADSLGISRLSGSCSTDNTHSIAFIIGEGTWKKTLNQE